MLRYALAVLATALSLNCAHAEPISVSGDCFKLDGCMLYVNSDTLLYTVTPTPVSQKKLEQPMLVTKKFAVTGICHARACELYVPALGLDIVAIIDNPPLQPPSVVATISGPAVEVGFSTFTKVMEAFAKGTVESLATIPNK